MIIRGKYLSEIRDFYDSDLIKIITGIRRCGKSVVMEQIRNELSEKTDNIIYLDFDDRVVTRQLQKREDIVDRVEEKRKKGSAMFCLTKCRRSMDGIMHVVLCEESTALCL